MTLRDLAQELQANRKSPSSIYPSLATPRLSLSGGQHSGKKRDLIIKSRSRDSGRSGIILHGGRKTGDRETEERAQVPASPTHPPWLWVVCPGTEAVPIGSRALLRAISSGESVRLHRRDPRLPRMVSVTKWPLQAQGTPFWTAVSSFG